MNAVNYMQQAESRLRVIRAALDKESKLNGGVTGWNEYNQNAFEVVSQKEAMIRCTVEYAPQAGWKIVQAAHPMLAQVYDLPGGDIDVVFRFKMQDIDCGENCNNLAYNILCWRCVVEVPVDKRQRKAV